MDTENRGVEFYPPEEADRQPWNDLPDSPQDSTQPPSEPEGPSPDPAPVKAPRTVPPLAYLTALLAAGFLLMTAVCVLQFRDSQQELDEVRGALENVQAIDTLREENTRLQERVDRLTAAAEKTAQELLDSQASLAEKEYDAETTGIERDMLNYLWFIQNFMESGNYAMAANAMAAGGDSCYALNLYQTARQNQRQREQYREYRQLLIDSGYLGGGNRIIFKGDSVSTSLYIKYEMRQEVDRWTALWTALSSYYIDPDMTQSAASLKEWTDTQGELIEQYRGSFAIDQYELLLDEMLHSGYLTRMENGGLGYGWIFNVDNGPQAD